MYPQTLAQWRESATEALAEPEEARASRRETKADRRRIKELERELRRKDKALAEIGGTSVEDVRARTPMSTMIDAASTGYEAAVPLPRTLSDEEWAQLTMPVRIDIAGTKSLAGGQEAVDRARRVLPSARVTYWPTATHSLPMQERETLDPQLLAFWRSCD